MSKVENGWINLDQRYITSHTGGETLFFWWGGVGGGLGGGGLMVYFKVNNNFPRFQVGGGSNLMGSNI